ncbi:hypothetical protein N0V82_001869 [Gnomoniopsis sp. IMI 355080]|nr:hypothetical protein N0V82_001869 [Gnomoniopsis sp. IMI 355080]
MESQSTPRITAPYLDRYIGRNVTIIGRVDQLRGEEATIDADGHIKAYLNREAHLSPNGAAQIIGKVNQNLTIKVLSAVDLGFGIDFKVCQQVVELSQRYKHLFDNDAGGAN